LGETAPVPWFGWLNGKLCVERGIVCQHVDDAKNTESWKQMSTDSGLLEVR